jgi:hypothetical protein
MYFLIKVRRKSILKYLHQLLKPNITKNIKHSSSIMNGEIATFKLSLFDEFVTSYKSTNSLASEAVEAFDQFLSALDIFFDLCGELIENKMNNEDVLIKWYRSATISSSDTIRATSNWYNQAIFDNISINMDVNESEDYITHNGMCFGKVNFILI